MLDKFLNLFKPNEVKKEYKLVLSLDGGGVRGLATVIFLKELEKASGKKIVDLFNGEPLVYKLADGKYIIDIASTFSKSK